MKVEESKKMSEKNVEQENKPKKGENSFYTAEELINVSDTLFKSKKECVAAALKQTGKQQFTVEEAKTIVVKFLKKEIE